ncbi:hypothetical protein JCM8097_007566 [Rhodosporidiobolus ruineniae]
MLNSPPPARSTLVPFTSPLSPSSDEPRTLPEVRSSADVYPPVAVRAGADGVSSHEDTRRASEVGFLSDNEDAEESESTGQVSREREERVRAYVGEGEANEMAGILSSALRPFRLFLIAISQFFFAAMDTCVKILEQDVHMPVWQLILIRMLCTSLFYLYRTGDPHPFLGPPGVRLLLCARGVTGFFVLLPGYFALLYLSVAELVTLSFLAPVLIGLLGLVFLREPYSRSEAIVGITSLGGTLLIAKPAFLFPPSNAHEASEGGKGEKDEVSPEQRLLATGMALISVLAMAIAFLLIRHIGRRASPLHSIASFAICSVFVAPLVPLFIPSPPLSLFTLEFRFLVLLVPIGIFGFSAQLLLTLGLQREKAGRGALATYPNLLFAMLLELAVFHTLPDGWSLVGAAIIVSGAVRIALEKRREAADVAVEGSAVRGRSDDGGDVWEGMEEGRRGRRLEGEEEEAVALLQRSGDPGSTGVGVSRGCAAQQ